MSVAGAAVNGGGPTGAAASLAAPGEAKTVALTGCTRGIGRALLKWFAARGCRVAGCGTDVLALEELRAAIPTAHLSTVDIRNEQAVGAWVEKVRGSLGPLDLLVCNAGVLPTPRELERIPEEDWRQACEVNLLGTARVLRHALPALRAPGATVVLVSSRYGRCAARGQAAYCATKWATEGMAKTLALELEEQGVAVVSLDPGLVNTDMLQKSSPGGEAWCAQQRSPDDFAAEAGPFLLSLRLADTGRSLTCPGSPAAYFETGVPCGSRPAWANGLGPFVRASEDGLSSTATWKKEPVPGSPAKRRRTTEPAAVTTPAPAEAAKGTAPRRYFISGVMLGSRQQLNDQAADLAPQDYRVRMARAIRAADPGAEIVDPLDHVKARAAAAGMTLEELNADDALVREAFREVIALVPQCDVIISNLPEASMGSAVELWEAQKAGLMVFTISPMVANWTIRTAAKYNFPSMEEFEQNLARHLGQ